MKFGKQKVKFGLKVCLVSIIVGILLGAYAAYSYSPSSTFTISGGLYPGAPSYTVWIEDNYCFAKSNNGEISFSGTPTSVLQSLIDLPAETYRYTKEVSPYPMTTEAIQPSIFIKAGFYNIESTLTVNGKNHLQIIGEQGTYLNMTTNQDLISITNSNRTMLKNLHLQCDWRSSYPSTDTLRGIYITNTFITTLEDVVSTYFRIGIKALNCNRLYMERVWAFGSNVSGYWLEGNGYPQSIWMANCQAVDGRTGIYVLGDVDILEMVNPHVCANSLYGLHIQNVYGTGVIYITQINVENPGATSNIFIENSERIHFVNGISSLSYDGVKIHGSSKILLSVLEIAQATHYGLYIYNSTKLSVTNNQILDATTYEVYLNSVSNFTLTNNIIMRGSGNGSVYTNQISSYVIANNLGYTV